MAKHDFFWAGDGRFPVQPPGRDREQGKGESAHAGRGQFGCRARAVGKARAGKPSTRAGFQKERSATAKQAPRRPSSQVRLAGEGKPAMQSAQTRKLRLWERVRQRYSGRLRGYATKPVRPTQTSYARIGRPHSCNGDAKCPDSQVTLVGKGTAAIQYQAKWLRHKAWSADPNELCSCGAAQQIQHAQSAQTHKLRLWDGVQTGQCTTWQQAVQGRARRKCQHTRTIATQQK